MSGMAIECLEMTYGDDVLRPSEIPESLLGSSSVEQPTAVFIRQDDLWRFHDCGNLVSGPRKKHPAKELSSYLLGKTGTPIVVFETHSRGQLLRSVRKALVHAAEEEQEAKAFIIAVGAIFDDLWAEAGVPEDKEGGKVPWWHRMEVDTPFITEYLGSSAAFTEARACAALAAKHTDPVLILGKTGTGKEVIARNIHRLCTQQLQREDTLRAVNIAAIPELLLESELFGHLKGSFSGAYTDKVGLWEEASGGTLFLDEIGDLSPNCQVNILRAIEEKEIRRVGSTKFISVDTRIIAATNQDLLLMVAEGTFRDDLLYRLDNGIIRTPSLCDSPSVFREIAQRIWTRDVAKDDGCPLSEELLDALLSYDWPGNVRQLKSRLKYLYRISGEQQGRRCPTVEDVSFVMPDYRQLDERHVQAHCQPFRSECLSRLRQVDETISLTMMAFEGFGDDDAMGEKALKRLHSAAKRHDKTLQGLYMQGALPFHSIELFEAISSFKGSLSHLVHLLTRDTLKAKEYWRGEFQEECNRARSALFLEVGELTD